MKSNNNESILTVEWDSRNEQLEIHGNMQGLECLKKKIDYLLAQPASDHVHLMSKEWGGEELSGEKQSAENNLVNHVKIYKWD